MRIKFVVAYTVALVSILIGLWAIVRNGSQGLYETGIGPAFMLIFAAFLLYQLCGEILSAFSKSVVKQPDRQ